MKKFTIVFMLVMASAYAYSQVSPSGAKVNLFYEDFETFAIPGNMHGWSYIQTNATQTWVVSSVGGHDGSQYIRIFPDNTLGQQNEWLITGYINLK